MWRAHRIKRKNFEVRVHHLEEFYIRPRVEPSLTVSDQVDAIHSELLDDTRNLIFQCEPVEVDRPCLQVYRFVVRDASRPQVSDKSSIFEELTTLSVAVYKNDR